ncbi:MAG: hypothetical protein AAGB46_13735 [Verrucomicrobiota bacterium]
MTQDQSSIAQQYFATIGRLIPGIAHELNNPIGFVGSNLETLPNYIASIASFIAELESCSTDPQTQENIRDLRSKHDLDFIIEDIESLSIESLEGTRKMGEIVSAIQSHAGQSFSKTDRIDLVKLMDRILSILKNELKYSIEIDLVNDSRVEVECIEGELAYLLQSLILNACSSIGGKGTIQMEIKDEGQNGLIRIKGISKAENPSPETLHELPAENKLANANEWRLNRNAERHTYELRIPRP